MGLRCVMLGMVGVVVGLGSLNDHHYAPPVASLRPGRCVKWRFGSRGLSVASKLCRAPQAAAFSSPHELQTLPETLSGPRPRHQYAHKHTQPPPQRAHMRARPHTIKKRFTASARAEYTPFQFCASVYATPTYFASPDQSDSSEPAALPVPISIPPAPHCPCHRALSWSALRIVAATDYSTRGTLRPR